MNYLSICSGIEAATVAWHHMGWKPVGFSEVEPFPCAVLAHHYPQVKNFGDMTKFKEWNLHEPVNVLVGGTPCQAFSIAGKRGGLDDPRGSLMLTYLAIAERYRPQWLVWENVPGVLSSNRGRDFGTFLGSLVKLGYGFAYRVLDAQWFGVAQRRRRVFVVGYFGNAECAAKVLFESESVCRNTAPSLEKRESVAATITSGFGSRGVDADQIANGNYALRMIAFGEYKNDQTASCLKTRDYKDATDLIATSSEVRRLTPVECERLQGFPDRYTEIPWRKKPASDCPDGPRYKALGNSMAVPVMRWIGERIEQVDKSF